MLSVLEKRISIAAIIFVVIYLGAAGLTLYHRSQEQTAAGPAQLETAEVKKAESRLALVQLFPPMMVLLTLAVCFVLAKKRRARQLVAMAEADKLDNSHPIELKGDDDLKD